MAWTEKAKRWQEAERAWQRLGALLDCAETEKDWWGVEAQVDQAYEAEKAYRRAVALKDRLALCRD